MSAISTAAAATAIRRAKNIVNVSGGGKEGEGTNFDDVYNVFLVFRANSHPNYLYIKHSEVLPCKQAQ